MSSPRVTRRRMLATLGGTTTSVITGCSDNGDSASTGGTDSESIDSDGAAYFVAPDGNDGNDGSKESPLMSINEALDRAQPGETIQLLPGEYTEAVFTARDGTSDAPITVKGPADAVIRPPPETYSVVNIRHHYNRFRGMTINGLIDPDRKFEDWRAWAANCVQLNPKPRAEEGIEYLRGAVVEPSRIGNSGRAMIQTIRIRDTVIGGFEVIGPAGMRYDPRLDNHEIGHVREILYIGSPEVVRQQESYPYDTLDRSRNIRIHHIDNSAGYAHNEFAEVKLGSTNVTVEYCTDRNAGHNTEGIVEPAVLIAGNDCTVRWNDIGDCPVPIGFNPWTPTGDIDKGDWAQNNAVYGNYIHGFAGGAIKFPTDTDGSVTPERQRTICGNRIERGDPPIEPWVPSANGFDGEIADRRGQPEVTVTVGAGPDGRAFDPPVVIVDPGTTVSWEWEQGSGTHYVVSRVRVKGDLSTAPDPISAPNTMSESLDGVGMKRYVCYEHHDEGMRSAVVVAADESEYEYAQGDCETSIPETDDVGHTGGDN